MPEWAGDAAGPLSAGGAVAGWVAPPGAGGAAEFAAEAEATALAICKAKLAHSAWDAVAT